MASTSSTLIKNPMESLEFLSRTMHLKKIIPVISSLLPLHHLFLLHCYFIIYLLG
jgi:hypothetical protein